MELEKTSEAMKDFKAKTANVKAIPAPDPFADDTPLTCGLENPEVCESCT